MVNYAMVGPSINSAGHLHRHLQGLVPSLSRFPITTGSNQRDAIGRSASGYRATDRLCEMTPGTSTSVHA